MTTQLVLNSSNYDSDTGRFVVQFPIEQQFNDMEISATNINLFNSFYNISSAIGNNKMTLYFPSGTTYISVPVTIPDGFYDLKAFRTYLESVCDSNYLYTLATDGTTKKYYFYMGSNRSYENLTIFYRVAPGVTPPTGATWTTPETGQNLAMYFTWSESLAKLYGYTSLQVGDGINTSSGAGTSYLSETVAKLYTISSLVIVCNLISNTGISYPSNILTSLPVGASSFGGLISRTYPKREWNSINNGSYKSLEITVLDQNLNRLKLYDTNALFVVSLRQK